LFHGEVLEVFLLVGNDNVHIVLTAKAVVHRREQTVGIRRKINANNFRALVGDDVKEAGVLVSETIVILSPDSGCEEDVERSNLLSPFDFETLLDPLAVLVDHGIDDVDERLVAVEQAMSPGEDVTL
jgi:hypothetical protein